MDSLSNEPVILSGNSPVGGYSDSSIWSLGQLINNNAVHTAALFNEKSVADARRDVKEAESEIRQSIHAQSLGNSTEFRGIDAKLFQLEKESVSSKYEAQIASKDATLALRDKVDAEMKQVNSKLDCLMNSFDRQLTALRERDLYQEINALKRDKESLEKKAQSDVIINTIVGALKPE